MNHPPPFLSQLIRNVSSIPTQGLLRMPNLLLIILFIQIKVLVALEALLRLELLRFASEEALLELLGIMQYLASLYAKLRLMRLFLGSHCTLLPCRCLGEEIKFR